MTCRVWWSLLRPLLFHGDLYLNKSTSLRGLDDLISSESPISHSLKDHLQKLVIGPSQILEDASYDHFFAAWRSLCRNLPSVTDLSVIGDSHDHTIKSSLIRLRPCSRPLLHLESLHLCNIAFPSFSALFRIAGALPSLRKLTLNGVQWKGAHNPDLPPSSTATFRSIKYMSAAECTEAWKCGLMFATSALQYRQPWHQMEIAAEGEATRSARLDVLAIMQAIRWLWDSILPHYRLVLHADVSHRGDEPFLQTLPPC